MQRIKGIARTGTRVLRICTIREGAYELAVQAEIRDAKRLKQQRTGRSK